MRRPAITTDKILGRVAHQLRTRLPALVQRWRSVQKTPRHPKVADSQHLTRRMGKMADDKTQIKEDRKLAAGDEAYEVADFAKKYGIAPSEAKTVIKRYGPSRAKLDAHMKARNA
jgi:parvulin-like peptidyl-prolyl isomerase